MEGPRLVSPSISLQVDIHGTRKSNGKRQDSRPTLLVGLPCANESCLLNFNGESH